MDFPSHQPTVGQGIAVVLMAVGLVASVHIIHHAVNYPFRQKIVVWAERWREWRRGETYIENPRWRPVPGTRVGER